MFEGTSIDDLIAMVETAERHAREGLAAGAETGPELVYEAQHRQEALQGVA